VRTRVVVGAALCVVGVVWIGQGIGLVGGSFMTGEAVWAIMGAVALLFGSALLIGVSRARKAQTDAEDEALDEHDGSST